MKTTFSKNILLMVVLAFGQHGHSQGFVNLDFEDANTSGVSAENYLISTSDGLPGWTAYTYGNPLSSIVYNTVSLGAPAVSLQGPGSLWPALQGQYSVGLQSQDPGSAYLAAIGQVGEIPLNASSIIFWA